jgi:hypothetical protein
MILLAKIEIDFTRFCDLIGGYLYLANQASEKSVLIFANRSCTQFSPARSIPSPVVPCLNMPDSGRRSALRRLFPSIFGVAIRFSASVGRWFRSLLRSFCVIVDLGEFVLIPVMSVVAMLFMGLTQFVSALVFRSTCLLFCLLSTTSVLSLAIIRV